MIQSRTFSFDIQFLINVVVFFLAVSDFLLFLMLMNVNFFLVIFVPSVVDVQWINMVKPVNFFHPVKYFVYKKVKLKFLL